MKQPSPRYRCWHCAGFIDGEPFKKSMNDTDLILDTACARKLGRAIVEHLLSIEESPEKVVAVKAFASRASKGKKKTADEASA